MTRLLVMLFVLGALATPAAAQDDFFTSSPGPLATSHEDLDSPDNCNDCHDGGRDTSNGKCLGCHDHSNLEARINSGKGFHASSAVKGKKCESCHLDHKGRSYDLMGWKSMK